MKLACLRYRRSLSTYTVSERAIPDSSDLAKHLAACEECYQELAWIHAAHQGLQNVFPNELPPDGFADSTWARLAAANRPRNLAAGAIAVSSATCAVIALLVFLIARPKPPVSALDKVSPNSDVAMTKNTLPPSQKGLGKPVLRTKIAHVEKPVPVKHRRIRQVHRRQLASRRKSKNSYLQLASTVNRQAAKPIAWDRMATWYEVHGDYRSAAAAYAQAVREKPTDSLVFNAGRTSECAGNVAQAVEYYARVLKQDRDREPHSKQKSLPRRGTWLWYENRDCA